MVSALAFFIVGSPPANAFGSEVLGCSVSFSWTAGSCTSYAGLSAGQTLYTNFEPHNLSGTYTTSWAVTGPAGAITATCSTTSNTTASPPDVPQDRCPARSGPRLVPSHTPSLPP
ncbi:hypothetical protein [Jatrophihabitans sp.]|jgi:hypothetical protein|uniref:hypothetical protein n=1 Tax=Jatrophihabitans sp. TaxID=1932789 RepID=UPI002EFD0DBD